MCHGLLSAGLTLSWGGLQLGIEKDTRVNPCRRVKTSFSPLFSIQKKRVCVFYSFFSESLSDPIFQRNLHGGRTKCAKPSRNSGLVFLIVNCVF